MHESMVQRLTEAQEADAAPVGPTPAPPEKWVGDGGECGTFMVYNGKPTFEVYSADNCSTVLSSTIEQLVNGYIVITPFAVTTDEHSPAEVEANIRAIGEGVQRWPAGFRERLVELGWRPLESTDVIYPDVCNQCGAGLVDLGGGGGKARLCPICDADSSCFVV